MTPDVVVDIGNSRMKWGRVAYGRVEEVAILSHDDPVGWKRQLQAWGYHLAKLGWAVSSVAPAKTTRLREWISSKGENVLELTTADLHAHRRWVGFRTAVDHPSRLGIDRFLTSFAAFRAKPPLTTSAIINVGTAMTVDFVEPNGVHVGGAILPGPRLMARSLYKRTAKLPKVHIRPAVPTLVWGANTNDAINLGIASAILGAADQMIWDWAARSPSPPRVFITGGDAGYFREFVFTADVSEVIHDPMLTLEGIRLAAEALP